MTSQGWVPPERLRSALIWAMDLDQIKTHKILSKYDANNNKEKDNI